MAQRNLGARRRLARIVSIGGLFLLSMVFAALPVAADKHGGGSGGSGDNAGATSQKHDGDDRAKDLVDNDANEHEGVVDNDANEHHDMVDNDANEHQGVADNDDANDNDALDNDANDTDRDANNEVNDNDDDDAPPAMVMPLHP